MEVMDCILSRRSVRKYLDKQVPWDSVSNVLDAGRLAPNAGNLQNWKFICVLDQGRRTAIAKASANQLWMAKAPVHIVIISDPDKSERYYGPRGKKLYSTQNCAAAATNMLLAAHNLGLGSCWVGAFDTEAVKRATGCPKEVIPEIIITLGYANEKPVEPTKFSIENVVYLNKWRGKIANAAQYLMYYAPTVQATVKKGQRLAKKGSSMAAEKAVEIAKKIKKKFDKK